MYFYVDGGYRPKSIGAYGSFAIRAKNPLTNKREITHVSRKIFGTGTNNTAELFALIEAVRYCLKNKITNPTFFMDSMLIVQGVKGNWRISNVRLLGMLAGLSLLTNRLGPFRLKRINRKHICKVLGH